MTASPQSPWPTTLPVTPSRLCLGGGLFGSTVSRDDSYALLDAFVEQGGTFLDTAHVYAAWIDGGAGASERTIGAWLKARGNRSDMVLGTKGGHPPLDNMARGRLSPKDLRQDLHESLDRLGVDAIDLYWLHRDEAGRPVAEIMETLADFQREGRVRCVGASNWLPTRIDEANAWAAAHGIPGFVANQPGWSLAQWPGAQTPVPGMTYMGEAARNWHTKCRLPAVAYSPQAQGWFGADNAAWAQHGFAGPAPRAQAYDSAPNRHRLLAAIDVAHTHDCTPNQVALAWLLDQPFPVHPIIGTSQIAHLREAFHALEHLDAAAALRDLIS